MRNGFLLFLLCALLGGCGGKDYAYSDGRDLKEGPGLFSGKDGAFNLFNSGQATPQAKPQTTPPPEAAGTEGSGNKAPQ